MRDVIVIGGGLSGLAAATELEQMNIPYTLIEVKSRLGGSIETVTTDSFLFDSGTMFHDLRNSGNFKMYCDHLGLTDVFHPIDAERIAFKSGTSVLIDALVSRITSPVMYRMAVSTIGQVSSERFAVCLENGIMLDTHALIVAAPARYAERMFYTFVPEISQLLLDYPYQDIYRVSLGYRELDDVPLNVGIQRLNQPERGGVILQYEQGNGILSLPQPDAQHSAHWPESDPLHWQQAEHPRIMKHIQSLLPEGVVLIGSDYIPTNQPPHLDERMQQGKHAGQRIAQWLMN